MTDQPTSTRWLDIAIAGSLGLAGGVLITWSFGEPDMPRALHTAFGVAGGMWVMIILRRLTT